MVRAMENHDAYPPRPTGHLMLVLDTAPCPASVAAAREILARCRGSFRRPVVFLACLHAPMFGAIARLNADVIYNHQEPVNVGVLSGWMPWRGVWLVASGKITNLTNSIA